MRRNDVVNENLNMNLNTERILMRPFAAEDINEFYKIVKKNSVGKWLGIGKGMTVEEAEQYVNQIIKHWDQYGFGVWAAVNKSSGEMLGHCGLRYIDDTEDIEIIYLLDPAFWGMGYASEAAETVINFAFNSLHINKLTARIRINNVKSKRVIEKMGFQFIDDRSYNDRKLSHYTLFHQNLMKCQNK
ncbi:GNAT family N-acetyltransferase [Oceanobacillus neutriphilus]|uniref:N-acetyltransferase n=1 Tax=Oceanobacillus neutriphilus TaxID=531815 RepID=A0ABQ2NZT8_9BACI|nr:GNAT family N-acetyltransferase [Oceanobacillus neutriphilus]GGP14722.1 N-acetyltransferase [Oceanobacillus neutriphilus]